MPSKVTFLKKRGKAPSVVPSQWTNAVKCSITLNLLKMYEDFVHTSAPPYTTGARFIFSLCLSNILSRPVIITHIFTL